MIFTPADWTVIPEIGMFELVHPEGRGVAVIRYRERVRPLERLGAIVRRFLAADPLFASTPPPTVAERLETVEGEHAALVTVREEAPPGDDPRPAQRDLGIVFGDDFFSLVSCVCRVPARFAEMTTLVRELVTTDRHMLGTRRRRFDYEPPATWQPLITGFVTEWYPPEFPNDSMHMTVYPANPTALTPGAVFDLMLGAATRGGVKIQKVEPPRPIRADSGLQGRCFEVLLRGPAPEALELPKICAVLQDERYIYSLEGSARSVVHMGAHRADFERVVASVRAIPLLRTDARDPTLISHWVE
jgi:hypothetical protein